MQFRRRRGITRFSMVFVFLPVQFAGADGLSLQTGFLLCDITPDLSACEFRTADENRK